MSYHDIIGHQSRRDASVRARQGRSCQAFQPTEYILRDNRTFAGHYWWVSTALFDSQSRLIPAFRSLIGNRQQTRRVRDVMASVGILTLGYEKSSRLLQAQRHTRRTCMGTSSAA